ncbi:hypothetical protein DL764_009183 [Monosporascus ibericus]|uniref:Rhodopsin domain-containing protein n=1 Tax=Monosporascus ibericus TaxID=155417 RepID=A0A4V1X919_9PEZI|nr:hypothetical protein DL764_009183 [Monosporascus ibericus]
MSARAPLPVNPDDPGLGPSILGVTWALTLLAVFVVGVRLYTRFRVVKFLSWEDWIMLVAVVLQVFYLGFIHAACAWGLGKPAPALMADLNSFIVVQKWSWVSTTFATLVSVLARISIALLFVRIFGAKLWLKYFFTICTTLITLNGVLTIVFSWVAVRPVQAIWNPLIDSNRWDPRISGYTAFVLQVFYAFSDLTYVLFPVIIVWRRNMSMGRRVGLIIVMTLGLITLASAILKMSIIIVTTFGGPVEHGSRNHFQGLIYLTSSIEQALVIIMGCIPTLQQVRHIDFTRLRSISSSLVSLIPKRGRKNSSSDASTQYNSFKRSGYQDLDLRPKLKIPVDGRECLMVPVAVTAEVAYVGSNLQETVGHFIRRTDDFSVAYHQPKRPSETV